MYLPTEIHDPETGERITFDEDASDDDRLVWEEWRPANHEPPPTHYHPDTEERFVVREGTLAVQVDGDEVHLDAGEEVTVPPGTPHVSYTGAEPARFERRVAPPGRWRELLTERFAYAHAGGDRSGVGGLLQSALWLRTYPDLVVLERPPRPVQRVVFRVLAGVARATGRTTHHPYPRDAPARERPVGPDS
jgi:mannose-6-phosphate isomerase-like protein (cupin superfamily)